MDTAKTAGTRNPILIAIQIVLLCIPGMILFGHAIAGKMLAGSDLSLQHEPFFLFAATRLSHGVIPWWNRAAMLGVPFLADPITALFYPPNWLALVHPSGTTLTALIALHLWTAGVFTTLWIRERTGNLSVALFAGLIFANTGFLAAHAGAGHYTMLCAIAWLPGILWQLEKTFTSSDSHHLTTALWLLTLQFLAGHPQITALTLAAAAIYIPANRHRMPKLNLRIVLPALLIAILTISGPLTLAFELTQQSARAVDITPEFIARDHLPLKYLLTLFLPNFWGGLFGTPHQNPGIFHEIFNYIGIVALFLLPFGFAGRRKDICFLAFMGIFLAAFTGLPGVPDFLAHIPVLNGFRSWSRSMVLFNLAAAALAGEGLLRIQKKLVSPKVLVGFSAALVLIPGTLSTALNGTMTGWEKSLMGPCVLVIATAALLLKKKTIGSKQMIIGVISVLAAADLFWAGAGFVHFSPGFDPAGFNQVATALQGVIPPDGSRMVVTDVPKMINMYFRLQRDSAAGYRPLPLGRFQQFLNDAEGRKSGYSQVFACPQKPSSLTRVAGLRWWLTLDRKPFKACRKRGELGPYALFEDTMALPRAWIAPDWIVIPEASAIRKKMQDPAWKPMDLALLEADPGVTARPDNKGDGAEYVSSKQNDAVITCGNSPGGIMVAADAWYPGWQAVVNGRKTDVLRVNFLFKGVVVPPGPVKVEFDYAPGWRLWAVCTPFVGFCAWAALGLLFWRRL